MFNFERCRNKTRASCIRWWDKTPQRYVGFHNKFNYRESKKKSISKHAKKEPAVWLKNTFADAKRYETLPRSTRLLWLWRKVVKQMHFGNLSEPGLSCPTWPVEVSRRTAQSSLFGQEEKRVDETLRASNGLGVFLFNSMYKVAWVSPTFLGAVAETQEQSRGETTLY